MSFSRELIQSECKQPLQNFKIDLLIVFFVDALKISRPVWEGNNFYYQFLKG